MKFNWKNDFRFLGAVLFFFFFFLSPKRPLLPSSSYSLFKKKAFSLLIMQHNWVLKTGICHTFRPKYVCVTLCLLFLIFTRKPMKASYVHFFQPVPGCLLEMQSAVWHACRCGASSRVVVCVRLKLVFISSQQAEGCLLLFVAVPAPVI